jgi:triphosphoribosyl-dephospho-CoA synthase
LLTIIELAVERLRQKVEFCVLDQKEDLLGPFVTGSSPRVPENAKRRATEIEAEARWGRLVDVDVYGEGFRQFDRKTLGLEPRECLLCREPAKECILLKRHDYRELVRAAEAILIESCWLSPLHLREELVRGACDELAITPKPGLVDRRDNGAHPDLSYGKMLESIALLPRYFEEIESECLSDKRLDVLVEMGRQAERRMMARVGTNAHKGLIFLGGLILMATFEAKGQIENTRKAIGQIGREFFKEHEPCGTNGQSVRREYALGGLRAETERGLPSVFEHGWPAFRMALREGYEKERAQHYLMAVLMEHVEDTTAVRRCGRQGLAKLKEDGQAIRNLIEKGLEYRPTLVELNDEYRRLGLTMGGVADCMAIVMALQASLER